MNTRNFGILMTFRNSNMKLVSLNGGVTDNYQGSYVNNCFVALGSNTTEPTYNDYDFNRITGLTQVSTTVTTPVWADGEGFEGVFQVITIYQNNTNNDVTISEIGIITAYSTSQWDNRDQAALIAREVLDVPVTLHPGDSYAFSISIL